MNLGGLRAEQAAVGAALRRERAILAEERKRVQQAAEALSEERNSLRQQAGAEVRDAERRLAQQVAEIQAYKATTQEEGTRIAAALRQERDNLAQERQRLTQEAEALSSESASFLRRAQDPRLEANVPSMGASSASTFNFIRRERAALAQEREQLKQEAQALYKEREMLRSQVEQIRQVNGGAEQAAAVQQERDSLGQERARLEQQAEALNEAREELRRRAGAMKTSSASEAAVQKEREELRRQAADLQTRLSSALECERAVLAKERQKLRQELLKESEFLEEERQKLQQEAEIQRSGKAPQLEDLKVELALAEERLARQATEFQNYRSRIEMQETQRVSQALSKVARPLLPLLDDFRRADANAGEDVKEALEPLRRRVLHVLERELKVKPMPSVVGSPFDPELHEAVGLAAGSAPPDTILHELEEGFISLNGEVLRAAKVVVCSGPET